MVRAEIIAPDTDAARRMFELMVHHHDTGLRVIVGTFDPMDIGEELAQIGSQRLIVARRATHEEFMAVVPDIVTGTLKRAPFYWEIAFDAKAS